MLYKDGLKRIIDFILSLMGIVVLSPVLLLLCLAIKLDSKGPIIFKQKRVGKNKTYFNIYKFRTMKIDTPKEMPTHLLEDPDCYITKVGKFLRKTRLDGKYTDNITLIMDIKCFFGTITSVFKSDGVVEGGTGTIKKEEIE